MLYISGRMMFSTFKAVLRMRSINFDDLLPESRSAVLARDFNDTLFVYDDRYSP